MCCVVVSLTYISCAHPPQDKLSVTLERVELQVEAASLFLQHTNDKIHHIKVLSLCVCVHLIVILQIHHIKV